jgi:predicted DNA-binding ribbon-helix-helix protein
MPEAKVKATVKFDRGVYEQLRRIARARKCAVGDLIRITVVERYGLYSRAQRRKAVEEIAALRLPVGSWQEMERESLNGGADA